MHACSKHKLLMEFSNDLVGDGIYIIMSGIIHVIVCLICGFNAIFKALKIVLHNYWPYDESCYLLYTHICLYSYWYIS